MKKLSINRYSLKNQGVHKFLLVMKLTLMLTLFFAINAASAVYSQKTRLTLNLKSVTLEKAFDAIEKETGYSFFYHLDRIDLDKRVSINVKDKPITEVLDKILDFSRVDYRIIDKSIIIMQAKEVLERNAQQKSITVTGKVVDKSGEPIAGANVYEKDDPTHGVITSSDGTYSIIVKSPDVILVYSFVGFEPQELHVANRKLIDVTLLESAIYLDEVVSIGYGTSKKKDLTGAIANVKADDIEKIYKPSSVGDLLRSAVSGLRVSYSTDAKNTPDFSIRGDNSLTANGNVPLIVIDGVIYNGDLADINVNDIESVDILKDASSASIYGSRATNGVVVFTTKKGRTNKATIRARAKYSILTKSRRLEPWDKNEVLTWKEDVMVALDGNYNGTEEYTRYTDPRTLSGNELDNWLEGTDQSEMVPTWLGRLGFGNKEIDNYMAGKSTNWANYLFHTGQSQSYDLSISGKENSVTYYWSVNYQDNQSLRIGDNFKNFNSRINIDASIGKHFNIGMNTQFVYQNEGGEPVKDDYYTVYSLYDSPYDDEGNLVAALAGSNVVNPLLASEYTDRKFDHYKFFPSAYVKLSLPLGITFTSRFTQRIEFDRFFEFKSPENPVWESWNGQGTRNHYQIYEWQSDNIFNWNQNFGQHRFDITGLWNAERFQSWETNAFNQGFEPTAVLGYHDMSLGVNPLVGSNDVAATRTALMGRINYSYGYRYNFSASYRRDGSSRFGENQKHANFPSISAGWTITEEAFLKDKTDWLSYLKLRISWGINGNSSGIGYYDSMARMESSKYLNATWSGSYFSVPYMFISQMANSNLAWEKAQSLNFGLDYAFFNDRIRGALDVYSSATSDLLLYKKLPVITGFEGVMTNVGNVKNKGFELSLNTTNIKTASLKWITNINVSYNKNEITSLTGEKVAKRDADGNIITDENGNPVMYEPDDISSGWFIGEDKSVVWDYKALGTWSLDEAEEAAKYHQKPGDFHLEDKNGDGILNIDDKQFLGTRIPKWFVTMTNNITFKSFDFGIVFLGKFGYIAPFNEAQNNSQGYIKNNNTAAIPYWTADNQVKDYGRIQSTADVPFSIYRSKSYVRIQNLALGYNFPKSILSPIGCSNARLSFNIDNLVVCTQEWDYGDPESYRELPRTYSFSIDVSF